MSDMGDRAPGSPMPPAAPPPMPGAPPTTVPSNGFAVTALVLGILSIVLFFTIWVPFVLAVLAIVFGALGLGRAKRGAPYKGLALAGLICGIAGIVISIAFLAFIVSVATSETESVFSSVAFSVGLVRSAIG